MKLPQLSTKTKLFSGAIVLLCVGILTAVVIGANSTDQSIEPKQKNKDQTEQVAPAPKKRSTPTKKAESDVAKSTFDRFGIPKEESTSLGTERYVWPSTLTPNELQQVAQVITAQNDDKVKPTFTPLVMPAPTVVEPKQPEDLQKPEEPTEPEVPIIPPVIVTSTPTIYYEESIVVKKGSAFNPYEYFRVEDSMDSAVSIYVDTSATDMNQVGAQTFTVIATNKFEKTAVVNIPVFVASKPELTTTGNEITLTIGQVFNALNYVQAHDELEGELTDRIKVVASTVDADTEGDYSVSYQVTSSYGIQTSKTLSVYVINEAPTIEFPDGPLEIGQVFDPLEGVSAKAFNGEIIELSEKNIVENNVSVETEGTYKVVYQVADRFGKLSELVERLVQVENEAPVIHGAKNLMFHAGQLPTVSELLEGISATDREDDKKGLSVLVAINQDQFNAITWDVEGEFSLTYEVVDSHGKQTNQDITIEVVNDAPIIHGAEDITLEFGMVFDPFEGITVSDTEDGSILVSEVEVANHVDVMTPGVYTLIYEVCDSHGKSSGPIIRVVTVKEQLIESELPEHPEEEEETTEESVKPELPILETLAQHEETLA